MKKMIKMPKLSANMEMGVLVAWNKQPGETIEKGEVIFEVETDKVVIEIESMVNGTLEEVFFEEGDEVGINEVVAVLECGEQDGENG
ncbi:Dihydrolipoyllysine-residue succinyltransferase component of 2-oxoglutarate dehydrogenase complex [Atribacter laminatus]|uniref:Dihydrolipoyllysine-residue succinyltransferase component of 2-oxoglutarate dehydrogenase complex n=2 Tax=Atribacter laminatus TaxID=2847778 RepID=A0A7T1AJ54_ATRLM|nr:Dihydrolipoyllysine-residue succinyltransferase component of 2-oxoglutarate dehydrogenase complex [Atribacter laminatus]